MKVKEIMTKNPTCCRQDDSLAEAARLMLSKDCGVLPIVNSQGFLVGMITDRDIACRAVAAGRDTHSVVQEFMTAPAVSVHPESSLEDACRLMEDHQIRRLAVVDSQECCCGVLSQADIAKFSDGAMVAGIVREISMVRPSSSYLA